MIIRLALIGLLVVIGVVLWRAYFPRVAQNPYMRHYLTRIFSSLFWIYLLRRAVPLLLRAARHLRFMR